MIVLPHDASCQSCCSDLRLFTPKAPDPKALNALVATLARKEENAMVRHEAAEALGAIADDGSLKQLRCYLMDAEPIVAQSCQIALDIADYEKSGQLEYVA